MNTQIFEFEFDVATLKAKAETFKLSRSQGQYFSEELGNSVLLEMVAIPAGTLMMGSPDIEVETYDNEKPQHSVSVKSFFMGKYPITQAQWQAVAALPTVAISLDSNPAKYKGTNRPVENISWYEAVEFCQRLSKMTGKIYRLPSEAEWEYACRARTNSRFHFGRRLPKNLVNCHESLSKKIYGDGTTPVGVFGVANAFGLYDMHGNVYEWCLDSWHEDYNGAPTDGSAWLSEDEETERVIRGGFWLSYPRNCRSAYRDCFESEAQASTIGFRVVCETEELLD
jgi:formylglycine-generating enzyme required for sulfatase activity